MTTYRVFFLGAPRLEYNGETIKVDTRKALALLAYLLLTAEPQSRDTLAALLWPESDQTAARAALRRTLSTLRGALNEGIIDFGREHIAIKPQAGLWCDVTSFRDRLAECHKHGHPSGQVCLRCLAPLQQAANLYKDDFMAGFSLRDSAGFDDWQFFEAEHLRRELGGVLERLATLHAERGEYPKAIEAARRWGALDSLNESAQRALITLYAQSGQRNAALHQYRQCVRILEQELGVPPLDETTRLYEAVKENRLEDISGAVLFAQDGGISQADIDRPPLLSDPIPLVGRAEQWEELTRLYNGLHQDGVFVALTGEAGIGKTRLAQEFIAQLQNLGAVTLSARCYAGESNLAYAPLIDLLRQGINQAAGRIWWQGLNLSQVSAVAPLLPELSELISDLPATHSPAGPGAQSRFYEGVCQIITALLSGPTSGALFIDNLDWADEASLDLLAYLARRLRGRPIFVLVSWQKNNSAATVTLEQILNDTLRQAAGAHLALPTLTMAQASELIERLTENDERFSLTFTKQLAEESQGLPLFLVEYLQAALTGELSPETTAGHWPLPQGLSAMLQARLAGLSGPASQILQTAAIIGRRFDSALLQTISGRTEDEIVQGIEELLARNLIQEVALLSAPDLSNLHYDFRYEQVRTLILAEISLLRRRLLHRRTAEALEEESRYKPLHAYNGQIAYHFYHAGLPQKAAHHYFLAGRMDRALHANADALSHFQEALALGYPQKTELLIELGDLATLLGNYPQAIQHYEGAAAFSHASQLPDIELKIGRVYLRRGHWDQAACQFEAAITAVDDLEPERQKGFEARARADWSLACHRAGKSDQASSLAQQALTMAESSNDLLALAQAHNLLGVLARAAHQPEAALQRLEASLSLARQLDNPGAEIAALNNLALALGDLNQHQQAGETIRRAIDHCLTLGDRHLEAALRNNYADLLQASGESDAAMAQLKLAVTIFADIGQQSGDWEPEIWKLVEW